MTWAFTPNLGIARNNILGPSRRENRILAVVMIAITSRVRREKQREWGWVINKYTKNKPVFW